MWDKFPKKTKKEIKKKGIVTIEKGQYKYPITLQLIKDGRKNKVFSKKILQKIYVYMFHGKKDEVVPVSFSRKVLSIFNSDKKKLIIIKNGDHSLSKQQNIKLITKELDKIVSNII